MSFSQPRVLLYAAVIFGSGALLGGFGHRLYSAKSVAANVAPPQNAAQFTAVYIEESQRRMNLSEEQVAKLLAIMTETRARMDEVNARTEPEIDAIRNQQIDKIRAMLNPTQLLEYEKLHKERDERRNEQRKKKKAESR